ncbi:hypothetical protein I6B53_04630 [Schaalia sp. 19OD2882]|nr:hypothetical protein I6B53_04630 [Schaalia sp. 19OD2882]
MLTLFLASLPIVGPIYVLILALGSGSSVAKKSWAIATIVWGLIALVTFVVLWLIFGTLLYTFVSESSQTLSS